MNYNLYSVKYCSVVVPAELWEELEIPREFKFAAVNEFARLKDGIEVTSDNLNELIFNTDDFKLIHQKWQDFLKQVIEIKADTYIFHN